MTDVVFDASSLFARSFYGSKGIDSANTAFYTTLSILNPVDDKIGEKIDRTLFCWDGRNVRDKGRGPKPDGFIEQREEFKRLVEDLIGGVNALNDDFEADDLVATAIYQSKSDRVYCVSGDKDLLALHGGNCSCYCLNQKSLMTSSVICSKFGVKRPSHISIALAVIGDKVDRINGVSGWGPAKVKKLFENVTRDMAFDEVFEVIAAQIPPSLQGQFLDSFDKTLFRMEIPGVPSPSPLVFSGKCRNNPAVSALFYRVRGIYKQN